MLIICSIYFRQPLFLLLLFLYCSYFYCSRHFKLLLVIGLCSLFIVPRLINILEKTDQIYHGPQQFLLQIKIDSLKVNGDSLTFSAKNQQQENFSCYYRLKNKTEKDFVNNKNFNQNFVTVWGEVTKGRSRRNLGGFDQKNYLRSHHYCGTLNIEKLKWHEKKTFNFCQIRAALIRHLKEKFPRKTKAYLAALFLGYKDQDFKETQATLSPTGILHFFSISGLHVHLFLGAFLNVLQVLRLTLKASVLPLLLFAGILIILTGGSIGIFRATALFFLSILTQLIPLTFSPLDKFSLVFLLCLVKDPLLIFQTAGQLSFVMALLLLVTVKETTFLGQVKQSYWLTLLAVPIICYYFYEWPLLGGLLTVLLLPLFKFFLLPVGFILLMMSFITPVNIFVLLFEKFIEFFESLLSLSAFTPPIGWLPPIFVIFFLLSGIFIYQKRRTYWLIVGLILLPFMINRLFFPLMAIFVDVGQGDAILFKSAFNREVVLIDTGGKLSFQSENWQEKVQNSNAQNTLIPLLKALGITKIDKIFITHGDTDHMGDLDEVLKRFKVENLILGAGSQKHQNLQKTLKKLPSKTNLRVVKGEYLINDHFPIRVFAPLEGKGENEDSLVLQIQMRQQRFLLTGDLHQAGEELLVRKYRGLKSDVLKLGHHGSRTSSSLKFIQAISPDAAVISCGLNNRFGHPHDEVLTTLQVKNVQVLRTDQQGMIYFSWRLFQDKAMPKVMEESASSN